MVRPPKSIAMDYPLKYRTVDILEKEIAHASGGQALGKTPGRLHREDIAQRDTQLPGAQVLH
jgi:hypothetical protein